MTFLTTSPPLARALAERNFDQLTQVQTAVLADDAAGRDLLVSAQTGSGKTVAYGLAVATNLLDGAERFERAAAPLALIVAPTRELALQVHRELAWLYQYADAQRWLAQEREYEPKIPGRHKVGLSIVANRRETGAEVHQDSGVDRDLPQRARGCGLLSTDGSSTRPAGCCPA